MDARPRLAIVTDMRIYDSLGPLARAAIDNSPVEITITRLLSAFETERRHEMIASCRDDLYFAPIDTQEADRQFAAYIQRSIRVRYGKPADYFVMERRRGRRAS